MEKTEVITHPDYQAGWEDCRGYLGEVEAGSQAYHQGFNDCLKAYYKALGERKGWEAVTG